MVKTPVSFEDTSIAFSSRSDKELKRMRFLFSAMSREFLTKIGSFFVKIALNLELPVKSTIKKLLFQQFCGGEDLEESQKNVSKLAQFKIHTILDYAVEGEDSEKGFNDSIDKILKTIELDSKSSEISFTVLKVTALASNSLLESVQRGEELSSEELSAFEKVRNRMEMVCKAASEKDVKIMIDAEESWIQGTIDALAYDMMRKFNGKRAVIFNTFQMYRVDMPYNLEQAISMARTELFYLGAKVVRGAYMVKERERAKDLNYTSPIFSSKAETDNAYNRALELCIEHRDVVSLCCGTHNENSNYRLLTLIDKYHLKINDENVWFSQLYGMSDHISYNLAAAGYNVAKYMPYGPVESVMPYLMRRAEENKAVTGKGSRELEMVIKEMKRRGLS